MRRLFVLGLLIAFTAPIVQAQTPEQMQETARFIESWQNEDGGFASSQGGKSSLGATSSAIRMLKT